MAILMMWFLLALKSCSLKDIFRSKMGLHIQVSHLHFDSIPYIQIPSFWFQTFNSIQSNPSIPKHPVELSNSPRPNTQMKRPTPPKWFHCQQLLKKLGKSRRNRRERHQKNTICWRNKKLFFFNVMSFFLYVASKLPNFGIMSNSFHFQLYHDDPTIFGSLYKNHGCFGDLGLKAKIHSYNL